MHTYIPAYLHTYAHACTYTNIHTCTFTWTYTYSIFTSHHVTSNHIVSHQYTCITQTLHDITLQHITVHQMKLVTLHCISININSNVKVALINLNIYITLHYITFKYMHTSYMHANIHTCMHAHIHTYKQTNIPYMHACMHACLQHKYIHTYIHYIQTDRHTYIHTDICTYIHTYKHTHTYIHACMHACTHTYIHTHIHTYIQTHTHTYVHTYIHTDRQTDIPTYIHTCMHAYIHTYRHTYIHYINPYIRHTSTETCIHANKQPGMRKYMHGMHALHKKTKIHHSTSRHVKSQYPHGYIYACICPGRQVDRQLARERERQTYYEWPWIYVLLFLVENAAVSLTYIYILFDKYIYIDIKLHSAADLLRKTILKTQNPAFMTSHSALHPVQHDTTLRGRCSSIPTWSEKLSVWPMCLQAVCNSLAHHGVPETHSGLDWDGSEPDSFEVSDLMPSASAMCWCSTSCVDRTSSSKASSHALAMGHTRVYFLGPTPLALANPPQRTFWAKGSWRKQRKDAITAELQSRCFQEPSNVEVPQPPKKKGGKSEAWGKGPS